MLLDFGLVTELAERGDADAGGTPAYMAPEQITGGASARAADWYAVGVMLYVALPAGRRSSARRRRVLAGKPTSTRRLRTSWPRVPHDLERLCVDSSRRPAVRPGEAEIRACWACRRAGARPGGVPVGARTIHRPRAPSGRPGRGPGRGRGRRAPRALVVEGEPGVGKSALRASCSRSRPMNGALGIG